MANIKIEVQEEPLYLRVLSRSSSTGGQSYTVSDVSNNIFDLHGYSWEEQGILRCVQQMVR